MEGTAFILTNNQLGKYPAKTTHGLIRGTSRYQIVGVIDQHAAGKDAGEVLDGKHRNIPVFATLAEAMQQVGKVGYCIIGVATKGGKLPIEMQATVAEALQAGISVVNGLHEAIGEKPELAALTAKSSAKVFDIRKPKPKDQLHFWTGSIQQVTCPRVAVLGTDCNLGKRTTARLLTEGCREAGLKAEMIYTGQTGWMQGGRYGFIFDCTPNDFVSGEVEHAIVTCFEEQKPDVMFIEGQSALRNPSGPCGAEFLLSGEARYVVLQHAPGRKYYDDNEQAGSLIPSLDSEIELIRFYSADVIAITLNTMGLTDEQSRTWQQKYEAELSLPVVRPLEEGVGRVVKLVQNIIHAKQ
jgi:uncharacterized NAD-dependent epimerase/dehydratase family protein